MNALRWLRNRLRPPRRKFTIPAPRHGDLLVAMIATDPRFKASIASWRQDDRGLHYTVVHQDD